MTSEPLRCVAREAVELECCAAGCEPNAHMTKCGGILIETEGPCRCSHAGSNHLEFIGACGGEFTDRSFCKCERYAPPLTHAEPADHEPEVSK